MAFFCQLFPCFQCRKKIKSFETYKENYENRTENPSKNHLKLLFWGVLGAPEGGLGGLLGSSGLQEQKKCPTSDSLDPPWLPRMEAKFVKNNLVGDSESHFVDQSTDVGSIFEGSYFFIVFSRSENQKINDFGGVEPLKSDDSTMFLKVF